MLNWRLSKQPDSMSGDQSTQSAPPTAPGRQIGSRSLCAAGTWTRPTAFRKAGAAGRGDVIVVGPTGGGRTRDILSVGGGPGAAAVHVGGNEVDLLAVLVGHGGAGGGAGVRPKHHPILQPHTPPVPAALRACCQGFWCDGVQQTVLEGHSSSISEEFLRSERSLVIRTYPM